MFLDIQCFSFQNFNKRVARNKRVGRKFFQNIINVLLLIRVCWTEKIPKINKRAACLLGTPEYLIIGALIGQAKAGKELKRKRFFKFQRSG